MVKKNLHLLVDGLCHFVHTYNNQLAQDFVHPQYVIMIYIDIYIYIYTYIYIYITANDDDMYMCFFCMVMMITYDIIHDVKIMGILGLGWRVRPAKWINWAHIYICTQETLYSAQIQLFI